MKISHVIFALLGLSGCATPPSASTGHATKPGAGASDEAGASDTGTPDPCAVDNGGCGDPASHRCFNNVGAPPTCAKSTDIVVAGNTVAGSVAGIAPGQTATVILGNDRFLASRVVTGGQTYAFSNVPSDRYFLKIDVTGHATPKARELVVVQAPSGATPRSSLDFATKPLATDVFTYHWEEDASRAGLEQTAYVDTPPVIQFLDQVVEVPNVAAADALAHDYNVLLSDEGVSWNQEHAYRLLETMKNIPQKVRDPYGENDILPSKWILTDDKIDGDLAVTQVEGGTIVTLSTAALVYATPKLALVDGLKGTFFSKRLHHALVRFVTNDGHALPAVEKILVERFGCTTTVPDYTALTSDTTAEDSASFGAFHPTELVALINMFEEMPKGYHAVPGLKYLVRRKDGMPHPWYATPAVAWASPDGLPNGGYIEFMDSAFNTDPHHMHRLILHEKAHFMWAHLFSDELKQDWSDLGGWYPNPEDADGWSTTHTTDFVTAYAHQKNPDEDMAESLAFFVLDPNALETRSPAKYEFIRDRIMHGSFYMSMIPDELTFEVLNLYPDYTFPGKIKRVDVQVAGTPTSDKTATVEIELHTMNNVFAGASSARLRLFSDIGTFADMWLAPVDKGGSILRGQVELSKYAKSGFWRTDQIVITDDVGNLRLQGANDYGFKLYVNNPLEDVARPQYTPGSLTLALTDQIVVQNGVEYPVQRLRAAFHVDENMVMPSGWSVNATLSNPSSGAYALEQWGVVDPSTNLATVDFFITPFRPSGLYGVPFLSMTDAAGNKGWQYFSSSPDHEPLVSVPVKTADPDSVAPELSLNDDPATGLHKVVVSAQPTNPAAPNGETLVTIRYQARDDKSGLGVVSYRLRDPQGLSHLGYHYHANFYTMFFEGDATAWREYEIKTVLPVGSAPGTWGLQELVIQDKADNKRTYDFAETLQFESAP